MISNAAKKVVVIMGAGPGTGFAIAKRFALAGHPVALLARQRSRLESLAEEINSLKAGPAHVFDADASKKQSVDAAFTEITRYYQGTSEKAKVWGAVYNPGGFLMSPLLEVTEEKLRQIVDVQFFGGFFFAQAYLNALTKGEEGSAASSDDNEARGFLAFTGASASLKGSAKFAAFSAAKGALRNLAQSTAREWQPQGVHVFHSIVDGFIDTEATRGMLGTDFKPHTRIDPADIAESYYRVAAQKRSAWTHEQDLRPFSETF
ncbi:NAD(P)-binding protein [Microstroma glucosiphilum]|uniref:NAD(P)-binding protein n=1 Tax=Pseudomicrostroma glucosiphilum TaxID=1684307 RepID=A0A316UEU6_9BASI|nr:NAD(P)-binding protein [Pseudomicrostroma glucosiphilum]PWN23448.1 NAD(P)-binding protein [Pseudomicrostroma glucosiphilum]